MKVILGNENQLNGLLTSFWNRIINIMTDKGRTIRGNKFANRHQGQDHATSTESYGNVVIDPVHGAYILHPEELNWPQEDIDQIVEGITIPSSLTIVDDFIPTPSEEI